MTTLRNYLKDHVLLFDGAMGTYFTSVASEPTLRCEYANITSPQTVREIHRRYLQAGAKAIKTNTFSLYGGQGGDQLFTPAQLIASGYQLAKEAAAEFDGYVFCDIGPIQGGGEDLFTLYRHIVDEFLRLGGEHFLFETFLEGEMVNQLADYIKGHNPDAFIIASFAVGSDGFTQTGQFGRELLERASDGVDSVGFNCVCGPHHMNAHVRESSGLSRPLSIMPNASYPTVLGTRVRYENNPQYFAKEMVENIRDGAKIVGGCCGTTPRFIQAIREALDSQRLERRQVARLMPMDVTPAIRKSSFYEKLTTGKKPIAVELDSPADAQVFEFMRGATALGESGVDLITIADCPVARARMDSSLLACKVRRELNIPVMPHLTCRDRNINATKALLLGLSMEEITDVLVVTGDPIPSVQRSEVKAVYEFNSRMLLQHIASLNQTALTSPFYLYAALNLNARNFQVQLDLAQKKVERGAMAFFTQPVLSAQGLENLKRAKEVLTVPIVGGILPIVSHRNAVFINNEIPGITVCDEIVERYVDKTREECTQEAVKISVAIAKEMAPYLDGYYLITPFKRVDIITEIIRQLRE